MVLIGGIQLFRGPNLYADMAGFTLSWFFDNLRTLLTHTHTHTQSLKTSHMRSIASSSSSTIYPFWAIAKMSLAFSFIHTRALQQRTSRLARYIAIKFRNGVTFFWRAIGRDSRAVNVNHIYIYICTSNVSIFFCGRMQKERTRVSSRRLEVKRVGEKLWYKFIHILSHIVRSINAQEKSKFVRSLWRTRCCASKRARTQ